MPERKERCDHCYFWDGLPGESGLCRRHAPAPAFVYTSETFLWPPVLPDSWCGEFRDQERHSSDWDQIPLESLGLPIRAHGGLAERVEPPVRTVGQLTRLTEADLLKIPNFGRTSVLHVREKLTVLGLKLLGD